MPYLIGGHRRWEIWGERRLSEHPAVGDAVWRWVEPVGKALLSEPPPSTTCYLRIKMKHPNAWTRATDIFR